MDIALIAFTRRGCELAQSLATGLRALGEHTSVACACGPDKIDLATWTADAFACDDALVFVGAAGIAVRAIAAHLVAKDVDPAVVVVDERASHAVALLSGHIGGANLLALRIGALCGADPVITTATDVNGVFAVDAWAVSQDLVVVDVPRIKDVSSKLLAGETVVLESAFSIKGDVPEHVCLVEDAHDVPVDITVGVRVSGTGLRLVPRALVLGFGCRRDTSVQAIEQAFSQLCAEEDLLPQAFANVATIDLKENEPGLLAFCKAHGFVLHCYTAKRLNDAPGVFDASGFVLETTGTDNVCERAAVCAGARLIAAKRAAGGITMAVGQLPVDITWPVEETTSVVDATCRTEEVRP